jgi:hypothetical protein
LRGRLVEIEEVEEVPLVARRGFSCVPDEQTRALERPEERRASVE